METVIFLLIVAFSIAFLINLYKMNAADGKAKIKEKETNEITGLLQWHVDPFTYLITKGFYVDTDATGAKTLRNEEHKPVFEIVFDQVIYDEERNYFICSLPDRKGFWLYSITNTLRVFKNYTYINLPGTYMHYRTYGYNNKTGILDKDYTELTKAKYNSIRMVFDDYFLAKVNRGTFTESILIDVNGIEILKNIQDVFATFPAADKVLVKDLQDKYFFFNLSDHSIMHLPYKWIWLCTIPKGKTSVTNIAANLLRAMKETDEVFEGYDLKKLKGTILNQEGTELFPPKYDSIEFLEQGNLVHFEVGLGDEQLWYYLSEEDFEHFDGSTFAPILYGIVDVAGNVIIPVAYTEIAILKEKFYQVNKDGALHFYQDCIQPYDDEPFWSWEIKGGKYGLYNNKGKLLLPAEYDELYAPLRNEPADFVSVKAGKMEYWKIEGDDLIAG
ncbi:MAG: hypothetical protein EOO20_06485 [Chryseobacterium sp.]|nr:MAG: hypothetical protein EOO20_06485 [Chryseobacterium sp.]